MNFPFLESWIAYLAIKDVDIKLFGPTPQAEWFYAWTISPGVCEFITKSPEIQKWIEQGRPLE